jgi:uncharacterized membrane protein
MCRVPAGQTGVVASRLPVGYKALAVKVRLSALWFRIRASYWFLPALMAVGVVALFGATVAVDDMLRGRTMASLVWIYAGGPEGARALLSTIAASMITVAALTFSITMVVLSQASSQFGPRLLINFMRDTGNQVVLGTFIATFLYCVLVLRTVRAEPVFVPHVSVTVAIALAIAGLGLLIYFIHHVAVGIHVDNVIAAVARDLDAAIDHLFPEMLGREPVRDDNPRPEVRAAFEREARLVPAQASGYIRAIDGDGLMGLATERDLVIQLFYRPGHFVMRGSRLARVWPLDRGDESALEAIRRVFLLGEQRTLEQDVEFAVDQLVEIALRALSPGVNDPFTAIRCVDRLGEALRRLAERNIPSRYRYDAAHTLRVITEAVDFAGVVDAAFDQVRQAARANVAVTLRLLETITVVLEGVKRKGDREALLRQAVMVHRAAGEAVAVAEDRAAIEERYRRLHTILAKEGAS